MAVAQSSHRFLPPAYAPFQLRYRLSFLSRSHLSTLNSSTLIAAASPIPSPILPLGVISEGSKSWLSSCPAKLERFPSSGRHSSKWVLNIWNQSVRFAFSAALALGLSLSVGLGIADAKVGVNKPELLPKEFTPLIDVAGFLSSGQIIPRFYMGEYETFPRSGFTDVVLEARNRQNLANLLQNFF